MVSTGESRVGDMTLGAIIFSGAGGVMRLDEINKRVSIIRKEKRF